MARLIPPLRDAGVDPWEAGTTMVNSRIKNPIRDRHTPTPRSRSGVGYYLWEDPADGYGNSVWSSVYNPDGEGPGYYSGDDDGNGYGTGSVGDDNGNG